MVNKLEATRVLANLGQLDWGHVGWWVALAVVVLACLQTLNAYAVPRSRGEFVRLWLRLTAHNAVWWLWWLVIWAGAMLIWGHTEALTGGLVVLALVGIGGRLWSANRLSVQQRTLVAKDLPNLAIKQPITLVAVHDLRIGAFRPAGWLARVVQRVNALDADGVLITGQWLDAAGADVFGQLMVLKAINKPCFGYLSAADKARDAKLAALEHGSDQRLAQILPALGVKLLNDAAPSPQATSVLAQTALALADVSPTKANLQIICIKPACNP